MTNSEPLFFEGKTTQDQYVDVNEIAAIRIGQSNVGKVYKIYIRLKGCEKDLEFTYLTEEDRTDGLNRLIKTMKCKLI